MSDKRAEIIAWLEEQEAVCRAATPGPWWSGPYYKSDVMSRTGRVGETGIMRGDQGIVDARLIAASRTVLPLALAAIRAEVAYHEPRTMHAGGEAIPACACGSLGCPTISRIHAALGLDEEGRERG